MSRTTSSIEVISYAGDILHPPDLTLKHNREQPHIDLAPLTPVVSRVRDGPVENPGKGTTAIVLVTVVCSTAITSLLTGIVTVGLPTIARDLQLADGLLLWPLSVYALTNGCTLLLLGSVADVVGSRPMYLTGCVLQSAFTLGCGLSRNPAQFIMFRALAGISLSFCLPSAVSIITGTFPEGKRRNIAFASMGGGQPIGFSLGLTLGGFLADTIGWRWGFHIGAIVNTAVFVVGLFGLPKVDETQPYIVGRLRDEIDWIGIVIGSMSLAMLSYAFASITSSTSRITTPATLTCLIISVLLVPAFIWWVGRQEKLGKPAAIPNSLWRSRIFTCVCVGVFITWGVFNSTETYQSLFFQEVQQLSATQASLRLLAAPISGALSNMIMGLFAHKVRADWAVIAGLSLTTVASLLMSIINPHWSYWRCAVWAVFLNPGAADALFTVANLVITSVFPPKTQALAGGVFNTISQLGKSVGLATGAVIASSVTANSHFNDKKSPSAIMEGYRAAFWYSFALSALTAVLLGWGLRGIGKVGLKKE